jgi:FixJ family two-component response regulator
MTKQFCADPIVHIVDDDEAVRRSLTRVIQAGGYECTGYASAEEFRSSWQASMCGCAIIDLQLPGLDGLGLQSCLRDTEGSPEIIFLTGTGSIAKVVAAMKAGAVDFLTKPVGKAQLLAAISTAISRDAEKRSKASVDRDFDRSLDLLTRREAEVLDRIVLGRLNKQVAAELDMSIATVKAHRGRIMQKLGMRTPGQLVSRVVEHRAGRRASQDF